MININKKPNKQGKTQKDQRGTHKNTPKTPETTKQTPKQPETRNILCKNDTHSMQKHRLFYTKNKHL